MLPCEFTVTEDTTWELPWSVSFPMIKNGKSLYEFPCHEVNHGLESIFRSPRHQEKQ